MAHTESAGEPSRETLQRLFGSLQAAYRLDSLEEDAAAVLAEFAALAGADTVVLYVSDPRLPVPFLRGHGPEAKDAAELEKWCAEQCDRIALQGPGVPASRPFSPDGERSGLAAFPLSIGDRCVGLVAIPGATGRPSSRDIWQSALDALAHAIDHVAEHASTERRLRYLNTYLTVSSMLPKSIDLPELLEGALYCCMDAVSAEAASILILDDEEERFRFYRVEGPAEPLLGGDTFPAEKGVAGFVLGTLEAEIVDDAEQDARFYGDIDQRTGFRTRNMIAVPLLAGEKRVGVIEVLNKADGKPFTADERLLLVSIADEIAFAIHHATVLDYLIGTYCKRRQGEYSCKGCKRPLGPWTPCMRYREFTP